MTDEIYRNAVEGHPERKGWVYYDDIIAQSQLWVYKTIIDAFNSAGVDGFQMFLSEKQTYLYSDNILSGDEVRITLRLPDNSDVRDWVWVSMIGDYKYGVPAYIKILEDKKEEITREGGCFIGDELVIRETPFSEDEIRDMTKDYAYNRALVLKNKYSQYLI